MANKNDLFGNTIWYILAISARAQLLLASQGQGLCVLRAFFHVSDDLMLL